MPRACSSLVVPYKILLRLHGFLWSRSRFSHFCHILFHHQFHLNFFYRHCAYVEIERAVRNHVSRLVTSVTQKKGGRVFSPSYVNIHWYGMSRSRVGV